MFLIDVACRRIAWDFALLRRFAAHAIARVTPAHVRGGEAAATLASLRQSGQNIEERLLTQPKEKPPLRKAIKPTRPITPYETSISSTQSQQSIVASALAALRGKSHSSKTEEPQEQNVMEAEAESDAAQTTSNLLAAKRRAQQQMDNDESSSAID